MALNEKKLDAIHDAVIEHWDQMKFDLTDTDQFLMELALSPADRNHRIEATIRAAELLEKAIEVLSDERLGMTLHGLGADLRDEPTVAEVIRLSQCLKLISTGHPCSAVSPSEDHAGSA